MLANMLACVSELRSSIYIFTMNKCFLEGYWFDSPIWVSKIFYSNDIARRSLTLTQIFPGVGLFNFSLVN